MFKNILITFAEILLIMAISNCQSNIKANNNSYSINPNIKDSIEKRVKNEGREIIPTIYIRIFSTDSSFLDTYSLGNGLDGMGIAGSSLSNDTITSVGILGTIYYKIILSKDSCQVICIVSSDEKLYKVKTEDNLSYKISLPCNKYHLTLTNAPSFEKGELLEGIIDLTTEQFFQKISDKEVKVQVQMTGYFKTILSDKKSEF